jgi:GntR family transcriptional regulator, transcriptional repressor for pyruvate dehydrogenase complex
LHTPLPPLPAQPLGYAPRAAPVFCMTTPSIAATFTAVTPGQRLSDQVAQQLRSEITAARLAPGAKLPTEATLAAQFGVSRTVVREAVSRLKSLNLVHARQGSGVYVAERPPIAPLDFAPLELSTRDPAAGESMHKTALVQLLELRRTLEAEAASRAAERACAADVRRIKQAVRALALAVRAGHNGVEEDLLFHRSIALAAHNPFLTSTLDYLAQFLRGAIGVTRANEARRHDFSEQVRAEHAAIVDAIATANPAAAQRAARLHIDNAVQRIEAADPAFWQQEGSRLARPLVKKLQAR